MGKKISVYLRNKVINPSGYYRIYQYLKEMNYSDLKYRELVCDDIYTKYHFQYNKFNKLLYIATVFGKSFYDLFCDVFLYKPDVVIINREICPKFQTKIHYLLEKKLLKNAYVIWDFDDAILHAGEISKQEHVLLEEYADKIVVLNNYLKDSLKTKNHKKVELMPTTDGDYYKQNFSKEEIRKENYNKEIRLIWLATHSNIPYLQEVIPDLDQAAGILKKEFSKDVILTCVCNKKVEAETKYLKIRNITWERQKALECMSECHIGIMPLGDNQFTRGKGGFKLIQYMSAGLPIIASDVGFNKEIVKDEFGVLVRQPEDWYNAVKKLGTEYDLWKLQSEHAKKEWENYYSYRKTYEFWDKLIKESKMNTTK